MNRIVEWAKDHPKLAIALGVGIVILIWLYTRRSSSSAQSGGTVGNTGLSESGYLQINQAELSAATALQGQQVAAGVATQQLTDQFQVQQLNDATQLGIAKLQADVTNNQTYAGTSVNEQQITAQEDVALATIKANQQTSADQLSLDQALIGVIAGRNNVLNVSPTTPTTPIITSSYSGMMPVAAEPSSPQTAPNSAPAPEHVTVSNVPYLAVTVLPGTAPTGGAEIPGVNYFAPGPQPFAPAYTFGSEEAAVMAGAGHIDPSTGRFVAVPGLQVTY